VLGSSIAEARLEQDFAFSRPSERRDVLARYWSRQSEPPSGGNAHGISRRPVQGTLDDVETVLEQDLNLAQPSLDRRAWSPCLIPSERLMKSGQGSQARVEL
jgi:hypothetical protein